MESIQAPRASMQRDAVARDAGDEAVPEHYRFLMVRHQDSLWKRHRFEATRIQTQLMDDLQPLDLLLEQRKQHWLMHCRFVLERLLMPLCGRTHQNNKPCQRAVVLIENRIDEQWLFTVLNTWLMCPKDSTDCHSRRRK